MKTVSYREYIKAIRELQNKFDKTILITDLGGDFGCPINMGVNWSAIGAVPADEAVTFAEQIIAAAKAAKEFVYNGYQIKY